MRLDLELSSLLGKIQTGDNIDRLISGKDLMV